MKLSTSLVAVKKINSKLPRSNFSDVNLSRVSELILKAEGIINPLILRRTSQETYEVLDGHFEYYAATKAREKDPLKGEMIGAFIIEPENEEVLKEQILAFRGRETVTDKTKQLQELEQLEKSFQRQIKTLIKKLEEVCNISIEAIRHEVNQMTDYESMTVPQLKAMAKARKIKRLAQLKKSDLIAALKKADKKESG